MTSSRHSASALLVRFAALATSAWFGATGFPASAAELRLGSPFGDHMVLQQGLPVPVWGWAPAGAKVTIAFAGQQKAATADAAGAWRVNLDTLTASADPQELVVTSGDSQSQAANLKFSDVLVGEVWLCGGQSNMERQLGPRPPQKPLIGWEQAAAAADYPRLREFYVPLHTADAPQTTTDGSWTVCTPETAPNFTAVGFYFARELLRTRNVPVGIIHSAYGGTPAEAWTSAAGLKAFPEFADAVAQSRSAAQDPERTRKEFREELAAWFTRYEPGSGKDPWWTAGRDTGGWETMKLPVLWEEAGHPDWDGVAWFHRTFDVPAAWAGKDLTLNLSAIDDIDTTWVNGREVGTTTVYNVQRSYRVPASALKPTGNEIMVRVLDTGGGGGIWDPHLRFDVRPADGSGTPLSLAGEWKVRFSVSLATVPAPPQDFTASGAGVPTVLYNAMIAPLVPYAMRGVTFYQGENNAGRATQYRKLLPALIADWRHAWGEGDFPFLYVQIAPHNGQPPEIREAQLLAWEETKNTAMVVTIDVGDANDIHPANKQPVGERLALAARALAYGEKLEYSGPVYDQVQIDKGRAVLHFTHVDGGLVARGGPLYGFTMIGADGAAHPAQAEIAGETVVVTSTEVPQPKAVRYGWANVASGNLFNQAGLPASPFRTDAPAAP